MAPANAKAGRRGAPPGVGDWDDADDAVGSVGGTGRRLLVLDEAPYLLARSPDLASRFQRILDEHAHDGNAMRLVPAAVSVA